MLKTLGLLAAAAALAVSTGQAQAGRPKGGTVMTPFGPLYNTNSPEFKQSGGNMFAYQQLMEQKIMLQQQQMLLRQQQQLLKAQKGKGVTPSFGVGQPPTRFNTAPLAQRKKKRRTYVPTGNTAASTAEKSDAKSKAFSPSADAAKTPADKP